MPKRSMEDTIDDGGSVGYDHDDDDDDDDDGGDDDDVTDKRWLMVLRH
jgi:hypothetical protein